MKEVAMRLAGRAVPFAAVGMAVLALLALPGCAQSTAICNGPEGCPAGSVCRGDICVPVADDGGGGEVDVIDGTDNGADDSSFPPDVLDSPDVAPDAICATFDFPYAVTPEVVLLPANVRYMHVKVWGAGGNEEHTPATCGFEDGGMGGYSEGIFNVLPGTDLAPGTFLTVVVGQLGHAGTSDVELFRVGFSSQGGGGLSGVFLGDAPLMETDTARALIVAGGGGSAAGVTPCIAGGYGNAAGSGGMPTMRGGTGVEIVTGGGGGYEGGPGALRHMSGTGGSGYVRTDLLDDPAHQRIEASGTVGVPPRTTDPDYDLDAGAGAEEHNGRVVIHLTCEPPPFI
jgi:hypothetical protein